MKRNGVGFYNRGTQGINNVISGKLGKLKSGNLRYPTDPSYPASRFIQISVYDGTLASSIQAMTDGVSQIQGILQSKISEVAATTASVARTATSGGTTTGTLSSNAASVVNTVMTGGAQALPAIGNALVNVGNAGLNEIVGTLSSGNLGNGSVASGTTKDWVSDIFLPLPNAIAEGMVHNYEEQSGWIGDVKEKLLDSPINGAIGAAAFVSKMTGSRSVTFDRNRVSMYTDSSFRSVTLSWELVPNNEPESKAIQAIVKDLKKYSSPESVSGKILLKSPHFFRIKFGNTTIDEAMQFYEVVLTDITVDYSPGGAMEMFKDDTPKTVSLSVTFKDREPKLMDDWSKGAPTAVAAQTPSCSGGSTGAVPSSTSTSTTPGSNNSITQAGGGTNAAENSGEEQAAEPVDIISKTSELSTERLADDLGKTDVNAQNINSDNIPSVMMSITKSPIDLSDKLPAESPYVGDFDSFA